MSIRTPDISPANTRRPRSLLRAAALLGTALAFGVIGALGTSAAANADEPGQGWIRVAHLSPDTKAVDVKLTALAGGAVVSELDGVAYGAVSPYLDLPQGTYVVSMVPAGSPDDSAPMIRQSVNVVSGQPQTVAAYGTNADIATAVFPDDLTPPADGQARVRVIQASTTARSVDIATTTGMDITKNARQGTATNYASVAAGPWTLDLTGAAQTTQAQVDLASGSVATLFVLDNSTGGVTVKPVIDSASVGDLPQGGIQTGGGATASVHVGTVGEDGRELGIAMLAGLPLLAAGAVVAIRRTSRATARAAATGTTEAR